MLKLSVCDPILGSGNRGFPRLIACRRSRPAGLLSGSRSHVILDKIGDFGKTPVFRGTSLAPDRSSTFTRHGDHQPLILVFGDPRPERLAANQISPGSNPVLQGLDRFWGCIPGGRVFTPIWGVHGDPLFPPPPPLYKRLKSKKALVFFRPRSRKTHIKKSVA
jgi:hypothetical protein